MKLWHVAVVGALLAGCGSETPVEPEIPPPSAAGLWLSVGEDPTSGFFVRLEHEAFEARTQRLAGDWMVMVNGEFESLGTVILGLFDHPDISFTLERPYEWPEGQRAEPRRFEGRISGRTMSGTLTGQDSGTATPITLQQVHRPESGP
ncbi:MAG: hypothetical protein F4Y74_07745 [Gemmatimonadales bacterium]|nr:hypothetical protein [Gemmatimonadales bacterium]MYG18539.1 hypothetical protein [Gemmatimonadales bacterium]